MSERYPQTPPPHHQGLLLPGQQTPQEIPVWHLVTAVDLLLIPVILQAYLLLP